MSCTQRQRGSAAGVAEPVGRRGGHLLGHLLGGLGVRGGRRLAPLGRPAPVPLCAWHVGHLKCGEHQVSTTATHDSHDAARTHETTRPPTCGSPLLAPLPLSPDGPEREM